MLIESLRTMLRSLGPLETFMYCVARLLERASLGRARLIRYLLVAQPVSTAGAPVRADRIRIRPAHAGDVSLQSLPRPASVIEQRFRNGAECMIAEIDDRFAGCLWMAEARYEEDEVRCTYSWEPQALGVWDFDVYVAPEYRMSRVFVRLWQATHQQLAARGVRWTVSRISRFNPASLAAHVRLGAQKIGAASFLVVGPVQLSYFTTRPRAHVSLGARAVPSMRLALPAPE